MIEATNNPDDWQEVSRALKCPKIPRKGLITNTIAMRTRILLAHVYLLLGGAQFLDLVFFVEFYTVYLR